MTETPRIGAAREPFVGEGGEARSASSVGRVAVRPLHADERRLGDASGAIDVAPCFDIRV